MIIRDKRTLLFILSFDFLILVGAFLFLLDRGQALLMRHKFPNLVSMASNGKEGYNVSEAVHPEATDETTPAVSDPSAIRKIKFSYRNSKPKRVQITGSFNHWVPEAMLPEANFVWAATVMLSPGDYTYQFLVDGRPIRDPNNPRTAQEGRSLLTVKPLEPTP